MERKEKIEIREMTCRDLEEVLQIEAESFPTPWSRGLFEKELFTPFACSLVAAGVPSAKILGYLCFWVVGQETHILNLAVHPQHRRQGIGGLLLRQGLEVCRKKGAEVITLEVRRSNYRAISLYRSFHFQPQGIRRRYYTDSGEDAVIMGLDLGNPTSFSTL